MTIINSVSEIKEHYSSIQSDLDIADVRSYINDAVTLHLIPAIGIQQFNDIIELKGKETASGIENTVVKELQRAAAGFMLGYYTNSGSVQINSAGISVIKGNNSAPVSDKKLSALKKQCLGDGYRYLEYAISLMESNPDNFPHYHASNERRIQKLRILSNSAEYDASGILLSPQLCQALTGFQQSIEQDIFEPLLGEDLLLQLKASLLTGAISPKEQQLLDKIKSVMSRLIMAEAIPYLPISIDEDNGRFDLAQTADSINQVQQGVQNRLTTAMILMRDKGESNLESLRKWLKKNASEFSTYTAPAEINMNDDPDSNIYSFI